MSFLIAPTTAEVFKYAVGAGLLATRSSALVAAQVVVYAASVAFAALAATYGTMTVVGVTAGVGFVGGVIGSFLLTDDDDDETSIEMGIEYAVKLTAFAALVVFSGRVINNGLGAAGKFVCTPLVPYVKKGIDWAGPYAQPYVNQAQPYVDQGIAFLRAKAGY